MKEPVLIAPPGLPIKVVLLLAAAVFINYVDRGNLATASPLLKDELGLSHSQIGVLLSAFFWSYAPLQPVTGWLAQRFEVRYVLPAGLALWATATALTGLATSFAMLLALRILLGIGESVTYPCNSALLAQRAPVHARGQANGLIAAGQALGPVFGTLAGGLIMATLGWRPARRRPVDGNPEPGRQPFGRARAACHGVRRRSHRPLLLGICDRSGNHARRLAGVRYRGSVRRASRLG